MALVLKDGTSTYVGRVVRIYHGTVQIMSDIYADATFADVVDYETGRILKIEMSMTDMGRTYAKYDTRKSTVDLLPEYALQNACYEAEQYRLKLEAAAEREAKEIRKGDKVRVTHGRTAKGAIGIVFWMDQKQYGRGYYNSRMEWKYGIALSDRKEEFVHANGKTYDRFKDTEFVWGHNVEKIGWEDQVDLTGIEEEVTKHRERVIDTLMKSAEKHGVMWGNRLAA